MIKALMMTNRNVFFILEQPAQSFAFKLPMFQDLKEQLQMYLASSLVVAQYPLISDGFRWYFHVFSCWIILEYQYEYVEIFCIMLNYFDIF